MEREGPDPLREVDDLLRGMGIDTTLPWLPETPQLDLFSYSAHPGDALGEDPAPAEA